jgi:hypothetical protein
LFDREKLITQADAAGIAIQAFPAATTVEPRTVPGGMNKK